jgi:hypothetical protein
MRELTRAGRQSARAHPVETAQTGREGTATTAWAPSLRESVMAALFIGAAALTVRIWAASIVVFPLPEDTAYYVSVARNLLDGRGLVTDALWSYVTPPLTFPHPAFDVWLPLPTFLAAVPMALFGSSFSSAQLSSTIAGMLVPILTWRLAADVATERVLPRSRARILAFGAGLTASVSLPLVLASSEPDSTAAFTVLALAACLVIAKLGRDLPGARNRHLHDQTSCAQVDSVPGRRMRFAGRVSGGAVPGLAVLGTLLGLVALTRNEAAWLALAWIIVAWRIPGLGRRARVRVAGVPIMIALLLFLPWALRDWVVFGSPLPGQALSNALSLDGRDIFAWQDRPTMDRYLAAGPATLLGLRLAGFAHNLFSVLLLPAAPVSIVGLAGLARVIRSLILRPLIMFSAMTFAIDTLVFPVATTWGTFLHAAGPIHVLLIVSALLTLDVLIARIGHLRGWTRPVHWLGPAFAIVGSLVLSIALLPGFGTEARSAGQRLSALATALDTTPFSAIASGPVITDVPIWLAATAQISTLALPNETPSSVLDLARQFGAHLVVVDARGGGRWPDILNGNDRAAACFRPLNLLPIGGDARPQLASTQAYVIDCQ